MLKNTLLLTLISILFFSCTIRGNYYLINSSKNKVKVSIELDPRYLVLEKKIEIKSAKYNNKKVKYAAYKKMKNHSFTIDSLTSIIHFELASNHIAYLGSNQNAREIGKIKLVDNGKTQLKDAYKGRFKSRGFMKYVTLYKYK